MIIFENGFLTASFYIEVFCCSLLTGCNFKGYSCKVRINFITNVIFSAGESSQTHNFHLLRHLTYFVKLFGPLWVYSCFGFEALNGFLTTMIHGTQHISNQVI